MTPTPASLSMTATRLTRAAVVLALLVLLCCGSADAAQQHGFRESFGEAGSGPGQLLLRYPQLNELAEGVQEGSTVEPGSGVAVDYSTGDVYVADTNNHRIAEFDPAKPASERFVRVFGADVGGAGVDVCSVGCQAGSAGTQPGQLTDPTFIAIDNDLSSPSHGDVYVADTAGPEQRVSKFTAEGDLVPSWGAGGQLDGASAEFGPFQIIQGIATDPSGNLWVQGGTGGQHVMEFDQAGSFVPKDWNTALGHQPAGIAVDGAGHLYTESGYPHGPLVRFTTGGSEIGAIYGSEEEHMFFTGFAVDQVTNELYADQRGVTIAGITPECPPAPPGIEKGRCQPSEVFGEGNLDGGAGVAVDDGSDTVYVASTGNDQIERFPVTLAASTEGAASVTATSAMVHGSVDPKDSPVERCVFQFGLSSSYGQEVPCLNGAGEVVGTPSDPITVPTEVHADLTGLGGGSVYHFRLRVVNEAKEGVSSEDGELETLKLAVIEGVQATELTGASVTLNASVDPEGVPGASCKLEWATEAQWDETKSYGATLPCDPQALSGSSPIPVTVHLTGLGADSTYHYRFVVEDQNGATETPDHSFIFITPPQPAGCGNEGLREVNASMTLPDCRAYELVTPPEKNGALIGVLFTNNIPPAIADDGSRMIALSIQCFAQPTSCVGTRLAEGEPFQFTRTAGGWQTKPLALSAETFSTSSAWRFNPNTGEVLFSAPTSPREEDDWYVRQEDGSLADLGALWEGPLTLHNLRGLEEGKTVATADFSHVLFESQEPFWSFDGGKASAQGLYEYPGSGGTGPQLVGVTGGEGSHDLIGACGSGIVARETQEALSADGRTAYFEVKHCSGGTGVNASNPVPVQEVFVRIDGESSDARTVAISEPGQIGQANPTCTSTQCVANTSNPKQFRDAFFEQGAADGSRAYFTSTQQLTNEATQDPNASDSAVGDHCNSTVGVNGCNLYLYEDPQQDPLSGTHLIDVSAGDTTGLGPEVQGMLATSGDGSHAYFIARGVLTEAANAEGQHATEGADNLYAYERDVVHPQGQLSYIATLSGSDEPEWLAQKRANVSPDGRYLVFESHRGLTSDARSEGPAQIYRYDAQTGHLTRISFGERGFNDNGNSGSEGADASIASIGKTDLQRISPLRTDPTMSDDGSRVFFQSPVALTPGALAEVPAGKVGLAQNIYEWEAPSVGSCPTSEAHGCVSLISDGKDTTETPSIPPNAVELLGSDRTGENVFFTTNDRLTPEDTDTQRDYYDARIDGGFPAPAQPATPCEADSCRGAPTLPPVFGPLATLTFQGPGNPPAPTNKPPVKPPNKPLTTQQKLTKALKACHTKHNRHKRLTCEHNAHKKYKPAKKPAHRSTTAKKPSGRHT
jgi:hypothetical protein